jgi:hypothetical protein
MLARPPHPQILAPAPLCTPSSGALVRASHRSQTLLCLPSTRRRRRERLHRYAMLCCAYPWRWCQLRLEQKAHLLVLRVLGAHDVDAAFPACQRFCPGIPGTARAPPPRFLIDRSNWDTSSAPRLLGPIGFPQSHTNGLPPSNPPSPPTTLTCARSSSRRRTS